MIPTRERIQRSFLSEYHGNNNLFTPGIHSYGYSRKNERLYFEVSVGTGIFSAWMVGITVLEMTDTIPARKQRHDLSKCFSGDDRTNTIFKAVNYGESLES